VTMRVASVFGSAWVPQGHPEYEVAHRTGELLAGAGWAVMTGGYQGAIEAASRGAHSAGGHVIGVTVAAWEGRNRPNAWVAEERREPDLVRRLGTLVRADALIAVGGGVGTLAEVALSWNLIQKHQTAAPLILLGERWGRVVRILADELLLGPDELAQLRLVEGPEGLLDQLPV